MEIVSTENRLDTTEDCEIQQRPRGTMQTEVTR